MTDLEFAAIIADDTKRVVGDIAWTADEDHFPAVEFRAEVVSEAASSLFVCGSLNAQTRKLSYTLIHKPTGRIYGLDLGADHHNPDCNNVGEKHKHSWREGLGTKEAYVPNDIVATIDQPIEVWEQFCQEARIRHKGTLRQPPASQMEFFP